jgi:peroxiredoxin Q/BCP
MKKKSQIATSIYSLITLVFSQAALAADANKATDAWEREQYTGAPPVEGAKIVGAQLNQKAPDFSLPSQDGNNVALSDFLGKKAVVVYFYPKDETPVCTAEACTFRDNYEVFKALGAEVIGISSDPVAAHKKFADGHNLPFILLSDEGGKVRRNWGVPSSIGLLPGRVTYVIDKNGIIRYTFDSQIDAKKHVSESKRILEQLVSEKDSHQPLAN